MAATDTNVRHLLRRLAVPMALLAIVVLGAALRLHGLTNQSLRNDELSSWLRSNQAGLAEVIDRGVRPDVHPPGYQILLYLVMHVSGDSETALRLPSVILGILSVLAIYLLGAYVYTPKEGVLAAALMAASWTPLYYSQDARPYSLLLLMSILTSLAWFRLARDVQERQRPRRSSVALYIAVAAAICYVHYYGLFLVFFQGCYSAIAFARRPRALIRVGIVYLAILALYTPWLPDLFADLARTETWIPKPTPLSLLSYASFLFSKSPVLVVLATESFGLLAWSQIRSVRRPVLKTLGQQLLEPTLTLLAWLAIPVLAAFFKSLISTPVFTNYNLIICLPAAYLLLAHSVFVLPGAIRISATAVSIGAVLLGLGLAAHVILRLDYFSGIHKPQFREAVQNVVNHSSEYPNSMVIGCVWSTRYLEYYFEYFDSPRSVQGPIVTKEDIALLDEILKAESPDHIWYVAAHRQPTEELLAFLSAEFSEIASTEFHAAHVWLYAVPRVESVSGN